MGSRWLWSSWGDAVAIIVSSVLALVAAIVVIRVVGLRSLSKMTSTDFAVTVAIGSIIGGVASSSSPVAHGGLAVATLLGTQALIARYRVGAGPSAFVDNEPVLLMTADGFDHDVLRRARVTENDVIAKLREANIADMSEVLAVVLETTGDVSVLHGEHPLDDRLLRGVRRPASR